MPNIKPVSDLRNYNEVLNDIAVGEPVFLTKNGRGRYAILDIREYEKLHAELKLVSELLGVEREREAGAKYFTLDEVEDSLNKVLGENNA
ncbi:MAG: type II toxin-antitoxin system prevent-host-death family antitoxin [Ruminococcus sp.]|nr:type II toxin-antitoxin system prevent-host-death family antitoxin [Ruminococcus sp.]